MNENRSVWALHGLTGGLLATGLLLGILAFLTVNAISVQNANSTHYYKIENEKSIKRISVDNVKHIVDVK